MKKLISLFTMMCIVIALIAPTKVEAATIKLNKTKATMEVDSTLKLKLGNINASKVNWESSNKKVATVTRSGTIYAKKTGKVCITAMYENKPYSCFVTVIDSNDKYNDSNQYSLCVSSRSINISEASCIYVMVKDKMDICTVTFKSGSDIITCEWGDWIGENLVPLNIYINDYGSTYIDINAEYSDGTYDSIRVFVTTFIQSDHNNSSYINDLYFPLHLYSNDGKVYLGKLVTSEYEIDGLWNKYSKYGSQYGNTIWNEYNDYGSKYSNKSAFNNCASEPPIIVDNQGNFIAYLTNNTTLQPSFTFEQLRQTLINIGQ